MTVTLEELLAEVRQGLRRLSPPELLAAMADGAVVLDVRTPTDRAAYGCIPGSIHAPRTVLEWRVAPDAPLRLPEIEGFAQHLVIVCNDGCSSSLAAATLQRLGFERATDLVGGILAWAAAGLPLVPPTGDEIGIQTWNNPTWPSNR